MKYRPDIDGLRAVAVSSVLLNHVGLGFPGGYVGVDIFFVISGYLITSLMLQDMHRGSFSLVDFWERRIRRILPALGVVTASSFVLGWFLLAPRDYQIFGRSIVSLVMVRSNEFFARHADYFGGANDGKPLLHTWSLSVEEQFYIIIPLLFWAAWRLRRQTWLGPIVALIALASFAYGINGTSEWSSQAYYLLSTRAWELLSGVLAGIVLQRAFQVPSAVRECLSVVALCGIVVPFFVFDSTTPFPGIAALLPVGGTVLFIASGASAKRATIAQRVLSSRLAVGVGMISYSLYLWHWPLIAFLKQYGLSLATVMEQVLLISVAMFLAYLTYRFVEQPFRRRACLATRGQLLTAAAVVLVSLLTAGQVLRYTDGAFDRLPAQAQLFATTGACDHEYFRSHRASDVPHRLQRIGAANVTPKLLVWGDSHGMVFLPALEEMCRTSGIAAHCAMNPGRPPVICHTGLLPERQQAEANDFGSAVIQYATEGEIGAVVLAGFWSCYSSRPEFAEALLQTVDELRAADRRVYFIKDVPNFAFDVPSQLVMRAWRRGDIQSLAMSQQTYDDQNRRHDAILPQLVARGVKILDPIPLMQRSGSSKGILPFDSEGCFYLDSNHLSLHGARAVQPMLEPLIDEVVALQRGKEVIPLLGSRSGVLPSDSGRPMAR